MVKVLKDATIGRVWLIRQGEETVGYIVLTLAYRLEYRGYYAFLDELYIREDKRGMGIGTKAMVFISQACQNLGIKRLQLEVKQDNPLATALYTKVGFKQQSRDLLTQEIL